MRMPLSRRNLMYAIVAAQLLVLAAIVAPEELNMALDPGPTVDVEIAQARASKDPFRGAYVSGQSSLDLDGRTVPLPADGLRPGERVVVTFALDPNRRPRITRVERGRRSPPFTATSFTVPGRVLDRRADASVTRERERLTARVGNPPASIALDLPATISIAESAFGRLRGPAVVRANLHAGFLGRRYFTDVRLTGRSWPVDFGFVYDDERERLLVIASREIDYLHGYDAPARTDVFVFDGAGRELKVIDVEGHVVDAVAERDGHLLALVSSRRWGTPEVSLVRFADDGQVVQRSVPVASRHVLGFDPASGGVWILAGPTSPKPQPPHFIQRMTLAGLRDPRLGPFESVPRVVRVAGDDVWVVETERHRVTRLDAAKGRTVREYRDLNSPVDIAVDGASIYVIEADRSQLTRLDEDGRVLWRVPRFHGLKWALPEPGGRGGWLGAAGFEGTAAGLLKFAADGTIARVPTAANPTLRDERRGTGAAVIRSTRDGRLFFLEQDALAILSADGATVSRVVGFRFPAEQRPRS